MSARREPRGATPHSGVAPGIAPLGPGYGRSQTAPARRGPRTQMARRKKSAAEPKPGNTLADKLVRLGIAREQDLVLHLPLRYEDHTHLCPLAALKPGQA